MIVDQQTEKTNRSDESTMMTTIDWIPKTRLGRMVKNGEISTMHDALKTGLPLKEPEIVDILLPDLEDEVIDVNMVQRMTDSGRRVKFVITVAVGNHDGYLGLGQAKGKEVGSSIRKAIKNAKTNIIEIRRGCGSWECGCGKPHTIPFSVKGKCGSVEIILIPAPKGVGLVAGETAKTVLRLAGIKDVWSRTYGQTQTRVNLLKACFAALRKLSAYKLNKKYADNVHVVDGGIE